MAAIECGGGKAATPGCNGVEGGAARRRARHRRNDRLMPSRRNGGGVMGIDRTLRMACVPALLRHRERSCRWPLSFIAE